MPNMKLSPTFSFTVDHTDDLNNRYEGTFEDCAVSLSFADDQNIGRLRRVSLGAFQSGATTMADENDFFFAQAAAELAVRCPKESSPAWWQKRSGADLPSSCIGAVYAAMKIKLEEKVAEIQKKAKESKAEVRKDREKEAGQ